MASALSVEKRISKANKPMPRPNVTREIVREGNTRLRNAMTAPNRTAAYATHSLSAKIEFDIIEHPARNCQSRKQTFPQVTLRIPP
jgi:hypothetical protein